MRVRGEPWLDVWTLRLANVVPADSLSRWSSVLSLPELQRAARFRHASRRAQAIASRALLRHCLSERLGKRPGAWRIEADAHGRPQLEPRNSEVDFNTSHTDGMVVCAVSNGFPVGVDVEHLDRAKEIAGVAGRFLSEEEQLAWQAKPADAANLFLLQLWTLKEALAKAEGLGLQIDFTGLSIHQDATNNFRLAADNRWRLFTRRSHSGYVMAAVCQPNEPVRPAWRDGAAVLGPV